MKRVNVSVIAAITLGIGGGAAYWMSSSESSTAQRTEPVRPTDEWSPPRTSAHVPQERGFEEATGLRLEVASLRTELTALQQRLAAGIAASNSTQATSQHKDVRRDPRARAEAEADRQAQMAVIESEFRKEPTDAHWAYDATSAIRKAADDAKLAQNSLGKIECHSYTCRVEIADDRSSDLQKALTMFAHRLAQTLPSGTAQRIDEQSGDSKMVLYMYAKP